MTQMAAAPAATPAAPVAAGMQLASAETTIVEMPAPADPTIDVTLLDTTSSIGAPGAFSANPPGKLDYRFAAPAPPPQIAPPQTTAAIVQDTTRAAAPAVRRPVQSASLAPPRASEIRSAQSPTASADEKAQIKKALASVTPEPPTIFEKLFGKPQEPSVALAYAAPDGGVTDDGDSRTPGVSAPYDRFTAVYDVSAGRVYLPNGTKLEAHSGLGPMKDNPRFANVRMRGPTPPHVYDIKAREALFHGVRALRLTPVGGEGAIFNRNGILAHTYMLGPNGDSNGCVSFRDYAAFLRAFDKGEVKRLVVVASVDK